MSIEITKECPHCKGWGRVFKNSQEVQEEISALLAQRAHVDLQIDKPEDLRRVNEVLKS